MIDTIIIIVETIGTIAFAVTGGLVAVERELDLFGVIILSLTTAVGGGMIRDLILGNTPPVMFKNPYYVLIAFVTSLILILIVFLLKKFDEIKFINYLKIINVCDAMGLGIFSVLGAKTAMNFGYENNVFLCTFVGVLTGIGGGMLRDIFVRRIPVVLRREIYAIASIIGTIMFCYLRLIIPETYALLISAGVIFTIRLISTKCNLTLPVTSMTR